MDKKKSRKEQETEQRKMYIMSCAEELFAERGYDDTSIVMIAEKSEFAVGSVYNFFDSKKEIFNALVMSKLVEASREVHEIAKRKISIDEKIRAFILNSFDFFSRNENFVKIYLYELTRLGWGLPSELGEDVALKLFEIIDVIEKIFRQGQQKGVVRKDIDSKKIGVIFFEILISYLACWLKECKKTELRDYSDEMYEILMNGIGAKK